jgi:hypothetical protein
VVAGTAAALVIACVLAAPLASSSSVAAQQPPSPAGTDPTYFGATGFPVSTPAFWSFFVTRGGVRTFGYPISNEFPLLGQRVQLFQRALLIQRPSGGVPAGPGGLGSTPARSATNVQQTATAVALNPGVPSTALALTTTAVATPTVPGGLASPAAPVAVPPPAAVSGTPVSNAGCLGDEMYFVAPTPYVCTHVQVSVTSQRQHNVQYMALAGALDTGMATERPGYIGWVWTWRVTPPAEGWYQFTFYADGLVIGTTSLSSSASCAR